MCKHHRQQTRTKIVTAIGFDFDWSGRFGPVSPLRSSSLSRGFHRRIRLLEKSRTPDKDKISEVL